MTLATMSATDYPFVLMTVPGGTAYRRLFHAAGTYVEMCKSFNLKKTLYDSSTVAHVAALRAEYCIAGIPHSFDPVYSANSLHVRLPYCRLS